MLDIQVSSGDGHTIVQLHSPDGTNRLTREAIAQLTRAVEQFCADPRPLIITGNVHFFSAGADLNEIAIITGDVAYDFSRAGQRLMQLIDDFPALTIAAVSGYCMGGGLDLALACDVRIAAPNAIFGHRGASLGLITGWGGTQRLPRLIGRGRAFQMFCAAEKIHAKEGLAIGLVNQVAEDPVSAALSMANGKWEMANEAAIDEAILKAVAKQWLKVAMVISRVLDELALDPTEESCGLVAQRIRSLVDSGKIDAQGDTNLWRHSEVRLSAR